jgi:hypothetical protein
MLGFSAFKSGAASGTNLTFEAKLMETNDEPTQSNVGSI